MTPSLQTRDKAAHGSAPPGTAPDVPMAVVIAHPDDESLWLSSGVASADRVVFCFGDPFEKPKEATARRRAVAALPLCGIVDLALPESGCYSPAARADLELTPDGVVIADAAARARYEANDAKLIAGLRTALAGCGHVYTHNPWGEYGHPEHIQVHRAVAALQAELGYTIWFSNYVEAASWPLAVALSTRPCWTERRTVQPDLAMARRLMRIYRRCDAWTWTRAHRWPAQETVYALPPADDPAPRRSLSGEWLLDVAGLRWWPLPWRVALRRLP